VSTGGPIAEALDDEIWQAARRAWPSLQVSRARFTGFLSGRGRDGALHRDDLYLACGCLDGDAAALAAFHRLLDEVASKLRRLAASDDAFEEAKQRARQVVVARVDRPPPLADYSGHGALGGWLRIALTRELATLARQNTAARAARAARADELDALAAADDDPETAYFKLHYREEFRLSFAVAISRLDGAERRALRYSILERLGIDDIARLEGVHRATAARLVARARGRLVDQTRRALRERLDVGSSELQSILNLIEREIDVSVQRLLA
jgi:RNA polymerase sigma-70 factor (ECF subfamily)